jgi:ADP-ribose pyrophosphatase YjhB (NUDIX family)
LLLSGYVIVAAEQPAGIVLYFQSGGEIYLLLAEHAESNRGWAGFGGNPLAGETAAETAARKGEEETRRYFKRSELLQKIKDQSPVVEGNFATYFVEVVFVPAQRVMNNPVPVGNPAYLERRTFTWMPYSILTDFLSKRIDRNETYNIDPAFLPGRSQTQWFWPAWLRSMHKAAVTRMLPWQQ